jgi:hypothetical protein
MGSMFRDLFGKLGFGAASTEAEEPAAPASANRSGKPQGTPRHMTAKTGGTSVGGAGAPPKNRPPQATDRPRSTPEMLEGFARSVDSMRHDAPMKAATPTSHRPVTSVPTQTPGLQRHAAENSPSVGTAGSSRAVAAAASPKSSSPNGPGMQDASSGGSKDASSRSSVTASSLAPAARPQLPLKVASSPDHRDASSPPPSTTSSKLLPHGRSGGVAENCGKIHAPNADPGRRSEPAKPTAESVEIGRADGSATDNGSVTIDERARQLRAIYIELKDKLYAEFFSRKRRPETEDEYRTVALRAIRRDDPPNIAKYHRRTRHKVRAAIVFSGIWAISDALTTYFRGPNSLSHDDRANAVIDGYRWVDRIRAVEMPITDDDPAGNAMNRNPGRRKLPFLPTGWELALFDKARESHSWFHGICVSLAIGVRPVEIERGVHVRRNGPTLEFLVETAKASAEHEGIGKRLIVMPIDTPWTDALANELGDRSEMVVTWESAKKSYDHIVAIGRSAVPDAEEPIGGNVLRHRFACLLKQAKWEEIEIARALGHSSTKQLTVYGSWNGKVRRGGLPLKVTSERDPKVIVKSRDFIAKRPTDRPGSTD